jgi:hypothetical protein
MGRLPRPRAGRRISGQDHAARPRTKIELQRPDKNAANGDCVGRLVACDPFPDLVTSAVRHGVDLRFPDSDGTYWVGFRTADGRVARDQRAGR